MQIKNSYPDENKFGVYVYVYYIYIMKRKTKAKPADEPRVLKTWRLQHKHVKKVSKFAGKFGISETEIIEHAIDMFCSPPSYNSLGPL